MTQAYHAVARIKTKRKSNRDRATNASLPLIAALVFAAAMIYVGLRYGVPAPDSIPFG
ncbi:MAG: hypothetical protein WBX25_37635 [Rhodomicrobium sp.]